LDSQDPDYHEIRFRDYIHRTGSTADKEDQESVRKLMIESERRIKKFWGGELMPIMIWGSVGYGPSYGG